MDLRGLNRSPIGKVAMVLVIVLVALAVSFTMNRNDARREALAKLPGEGGRDHCAVWFVGSSTIYRWENIAADMAPWHVVRRGVNGATLEQLSSRLANDPISVPPRAVVLYAGENDLAGGATADSVFADLDRLLAVKTRKLGAVPVILVSLKPSPTRWQNRPEQLKYNARMKRLASEHAELKYVEIGPLLMDKGKPGNYYVEDGIHLKPSAYKRWTPVLNTALAQHLGKSDCEPQDGVKGA
jgi:lysophospholipase L1-like esterase